MKLKTDATEADKSLALAELMDWDLSDVLGDDYITTAMGQTDFLAKT